MISLANKPPRFLIKPSAVFAFVLLTFSQLYADLKEGKVVFEMYCASCHGPEGAGLIGPNLTDATVLHGSSHEEIVAVIQNGIPSKAMPAWNAVLQPQQIDDVALFVKSIMGKNLPTPVLTGESTVTPFPKGSVNRPLLMRTFMPTLDLDDDVFAYHHDSRETPKYTHKTAYFDPVKRDRPIDGIPGAITVNFGNQLSYCFDSTECRLLYTWSGGFIDMTNYWGAGSGNKRIKFGYIGELIGATGYLAKGKAPLAGKPQFKGYRKVNSIPEFNYTIGEVEFTLRIQPGESPGDAVCHYTSKNWKGKRQLEFSEANASQLSSDKGTFNKGILTLSAKEAKSFTITIKAQP
ncbi:c-type cytochrome [Pelagicoccus mobilis]|uniref:C-type cytochrome n=1 Tax=Pelagicoccus mobilis TaxID=415221 RepID=A0A934S5N5_9BACT|nr:cytochrome c [Pelagicoccus mobilis]MBK1879849.1 c-type cytochrome [Pelagicoccus mobilis]